MEEIKMGMGKILLIIAVILGAMWYFMPTEFNKIKTFTQEKILDPVLSNVNKNTTQTQTSSNITTTTNTTTITQTTLSEDGIDPCTLPHKGYPDYFGTDKHGDTCADVATSNDIECLSNPPISYDGTINLAQRTSNPEIRCCIPTGYCHWGD